MVVEVEIDWDEYYLLARTMRRLSARTRIWDATLNGGRGGHRWVKALRAATVPRGLEIDRVTGEFEHRQRRRVRRPVRRMAQSSGYLCANDAPALARTLAQLRGACLDPPAVAGELKRAAARAKKAARPVRDPVRLGVLRVEAANPTDPVRQARAARWDRQTVTVDQEQTMIPLDDEADGPGPDLDVIRSRMNAASQAARRAREDQEHARALPVVDPPE